jgi:predicted amidohydrolase
MKSFSISLGQMRCDMESVEKNEEKISLWIKKAASEGSALLVLPELSLTGYRDFSNEPDGAGLNLKISDSLHNISETSRREYVDVLISYPLLTEDGVFIASSYIETGKTIAVHKKINLCNYAHYTEHLHFIPGDIVTVAESGVSNFGVMICEDSWHIINSIVAAGLGAEVLLNPSAASVLAGADVGACLENWKKISAGSAFCATSYFVFCNQAGKTGSGAFMGGSHVVDPAGRIIGKPASVDETMIHVGLDADFLSEIREMRPLIKNERMGIYAKYCGR